jgi:hypothetical protein
VNLPVLQVKIVSLQPLAQHWPHFGMPLVNPLSSIAAKEIFESVLPLQNVFLACAIPSQLAHR